MTPVWLFLCLIVQQVGGDRNDELVKDLLRALILRGLPRDRDMHNKDPLASMICADNPKWRNSKFGSGTVSCEYYARNSDSCTGSRPFNEEIRHECPASCGLCKVERPNMGVPRAVDKDKDEEEELPDPFAGDACVKVAKRVCEYATQKGDGMCDDGNNNAGCQWDGGDCCGPKNDYRYCDDCKCHNCTFVLIDDCVSHITGHCLLEMYKGDKICDDGNNNAFCNWDGGDCCGKENDYSKCRQCDCRDCNHQDVHCSGKCNMPKVVGDRLCDDENNNCGCDWDQGDCCGDKHKQQFDYCEECLCLDPTFECEKPCFSDRWKHDGVCDDVNNHCGCNWDGGDCCGFSHNLKQRSTCKNCSCLDPHYTPTPVHCNVTCARAAWSGDGMCDDGNNICGCNWDGGDCCLPSVGREAVQFRTCSNCECLDPSLAGIHPARAHFPKPTKQKLTLSDTGKQKLKKLTRTDVQDVAKLKPALRQSNARTSK